MVVKIINKSPFENPTYATVDSAGFDLRANITEPITLNPLERYLFPTGLHFGLVKGTKFDVRPKSGLAIKHGVTVLNTPGLVDKDYTGEVKVILVNLSNEPYTVSPGEKIAQGVITRYEKVEWENVDALEETERGAGGFGSSGKF